MMHVHAAGQTYNLDFDQVSNVDVMALEDLTGITFAEWAGRLRQGNASARDATEIVWLARRQCGEPALAFTEVSFPLLSFSIEADEADQASAEQPATGADPTPGSPPPTGEPSSGSDSPVAVAST